MIAAVKGILNEKGPDWVLISIGGLVMQIYVPSALIDDLGNTHDEVMLHTRLIIRDDEPIMYGFPTKECLRLFFMLTGISGVGPRTALNLLSALSPENLSSAVAIGDLEAFTGVPGIGKRNAARIVLELKGKLDQEQQNVSNTIQDGNQDVISALTSLGYSNNEARQALNNIEDAATLDLEERVRKALQYLGYGA